MVTISNVLQRTNLEGKPFVVLELAGELQIQRSQGTGNSYAFIPKTSIPCTFSEETARELIGSTLPGEIIKVPCEAYSFINPNTKEQMTLTYRYSYNSPESTPPAEAKSSVQKVKEVEVL